MTVYIVGHKNPDTDSVCSAIALADLINSLGSDAKPCIQGPLNPETKFVLDKFGLETPEFLDDATGKDIILVDHSDISQTIDNLHKGMLKGIIDHHKLGDITTKEPIEVWIWPVGCTCTVIKGMYDFYNFSIKKSIAGIMVSAILSDTIIFKSATCTARDKQVAQRLAEFAGIEDLKEFGMELFRKKSNIEGASLRELIYRDYKDFNMSGKKIGIGQLETVDISMFDNLKKGLKDELQKMKEEGREAVYLLLTDIMKEGSLMLIATDDSSFVVNAFDETPENDEVWLDYVMSRKKQVVPNFEKAYAGEILQKSINNISDESINNSSDDENNDSDKNKSTNFSSNLNNDESIELVASAAASVSAIAQNADERINQGPEEILSKDDDSDEETIDDDSDDNLEEENSDDSDEETTDDDSDDNLEEENSDDSDEETIDDNSDDNLEEENSDDSEEETTDDDSDDNLEEENSDDSDEETIDDNSDDNLEEVNSDDSEEETTDDDSDDNLEEVNSDDSDEETIDDNSDDNLEEENSDDSDEETTDDDSDEETIDDNSDDNLEEENSDDSDVKPKWNIQDIPPTGSEYSSYDNRDDSDEVEELEESDSKKDINIESEKDSGFIKDDDDKPEKSEEIKKSEDVLFNFAKAGTDRVNR